MKSTHDYRGEFRSAWRKYGRARNKWRGYCQITTYSKRNQDELNRLVEVMDHYGNTLVIKRNALLKHLNLPKVVCYSDDYYDVLMGYKK